jgi:methylenetetrahydrofolate dehydrogenase (NADP+)/methenyltetrahydrofolate cyclohydrolase
MEILDGKNLSAKIKDEVLGGASSYKQTPVLAVISVGENDASKIYIRNKMKACEYVGMSFLHIHYSENDDEEKIIKKIKSLNKDNSINGILLQLPLPKKFNTDRILNTISEEKDVDGLGFTTQGKMFNKKPSFVPCTPKGIMEILDYYKINLEGKHVVVVGRSNLVGKSVMIECLNRNATCTICHSKTKDLSYYTKQADVLIVAVGKKYLIDKDMIKDGVVIIDVGINREGDRIYGDVNPNVEEKCSYLTPVPGGVGPMTVAMLLKNALIAYKRQNGIEDE